MAGIPAGTVLLVAVGGVLVYAGFTSQNPLAALKAVSTGKPEAIRNTPGVDQASFRTSNLGSSAGGVVETGYADVASGEGLPNLPRACERYANDKYSQINRWSNGYSDCSSFVGKGLKLIGVKPPSGSTTATFLASKDWKRVASSDVQAGDLAISLNHVVVCYGNGYAIGQQNRRSNVQRGKVSDLMVGNKPFVYLRYEPKSASPPNSARA